MKVPSLDRKDTLAAEDKVKLTITHVLLRFSLLGDAAAGQAHSVTYMVRVQTLPPASPRMPRPGDLLDGIKRLTTMRPFRQRKDGSKGLAPASISENDPPTPTRCCVPPWIAPCC